MRVTPEQAEPEGSSSKEVCNFRVWVYREVMGRNAGWDWNRWYSWWQKQGRDAQIELCVRYEIECEPGRYV